MRPRTQKQPQVKKELCRVLDDVDVDVDNILSVAGMFNRQTAQDATKSSKHCETSYTDHFTVYPHL